MFGKTVFFLFGENQFPVGNHFEHPASGFNQFHFYAGFLFNRFRQTGGIGIVVSFHTIFNGYFPGHGYLLSSGYPYVRVF